MSYQIDRRRLLKAGLAGAVAAAMPARVLAATDAGRIVPPLLMERARRALDRYPGLKGDRIFIADFSRASADPRFHMVNLESGRTDSLLVTHGRGSDPAYSGYLRQFSNEMGSAATSSGAFRTGRIYAGKHGASRRLAGLESSNDNAYARAIVVHGAWYADPALLRAHGKLGRSEGCFAVSQEDIGPLLDRLGEGRLIYAGRTA
ncbi:MAG: murein L,D-transpeptidase catalytic domain family protein [Sphingobium sp.]